MKSTFTKFAYGVGLVVALLGVSPRPAGAQAVFTNGAGLALGIQETGAMGVNGTLPAQAGAPAFTTLVGLSFVANYGGATPTWRDATTPGCLCEGFGVSVNGSIAGFDSNANGEGGLTVLDPGGTVIGTNSFSTLVALSGLPGVTIEHLFAPSASPFLYDATVTISNTTASTVTNVQYTRVMDWDVPPTEFSEFVTLQGVGLGNLVDSCNNGFQTGNPLADCDSSGGLASPLLEDINFVDAGPADHGARFTFNFGSLAAGAAKTFHIYYGAAPTEAAALAALGAVGAEGIYSFGQSNTPGGPTLGTPATFIFGFGGVGAPPITGSAVPEPASMLLLGTGLVGGLARRFRQNKKK